MKIIGTGLTGLIGTRFTELLGNSYELEFINLENGVNILDGNATLNSISASKSPVVLHMAAKTNVDACETDKPRDMQILKFKKKQDIERAFIDEQTAYGINVFGTRNVIEACKKSNKKIIYISTDFVFDGTKNHYDEKDKPNPINWYAKTKYEGEKLVQNSGLDYIIVRLAYPYRALFERTDFVRSIKEKLYRSNNLKMVTDHIIVPTFIDDLVNALDILIQRNVNGIFHVVGSQAITPYDAAIKIARIFNLDEGIISKTTRKEYFAGKAARPFCLNLKNAKIGNLGIEMSTFDKGLIEIMNQLERMHI
jgi:dTDP-4-dehydrorhamnose reductase